LPVALKGATPRRTANQRSGLRNPDIVRLAPLLPIGTPLEIR
jgi:hypothetical protein